MKMMWWNKHHPDVVYCDIRDVDKEVIWESDDGKEKRTCEVKPDIVADFRHLPFEDETFWHVVFDPPHLFSIGHSSWMAKKYGTLEKNDWQEYIRQGFDECWRVLKPNGTLVLKWSDKDVKVPELVKAIGREPLYGQRSMRNRDTHWMAFVK